MENGHENQGFGYDPIDPALSDEERAYRNALGDALETVLGNGANDLAAMSAGLNGLGFRACGGAAWTEALLESELNRLSR